MAEKPDPPTGTLTFLFTDIEGSTRLWSRQPEAMKVALARHDAILRGAIESLGGYVFKTVGDAFCAAFPTAIAGVKAALAAQRALRDPIDRLQIKARMALHTGEAQERDRDYFGPAINQVARILSAGHGGQILLSLATEELIRDQLPDDITLRDLGEARLKDLPRPIELFQLIAHDLPTDFPSLKTLDVPAHNLPFQPLPLFGRETELEQTQTLILKPGVRLLTLSGPGGTGKTRLGLELASKLVDNFSDGVYFVPLAPVTDPGLVTTTIAHTLGLGEQGSREVREVLFEDLRPKNLLLLIDNFEQVIDAAAEIAQLLEQTPGVKVVITSRQPLRLRMEREYPVSPLKPPDLSKSLPVSALSINPAMRLFVSRVQAFRPDFKLDEANAPVVAEICCRLDGLPLAIELAAARTKLLTPQAILKRLAGSNGKTSLRLLTGGARDAPERQRTLRAAIGWSYDLLPPDERAYFRRLSIFSGGFNLAAAEAICTPLDDPSKSLPALGIDALDGTGSLLDKSLLRSGGDVEGEPRFAMLEMIREYARERLEESGEAPPVTQCHAVYFQEFALQARGHLEEEDQARWLYLIDAEYANLRAALKWSIDQKNRALAAGLGIPLTMYWLMRGYLTEGRAWLDQILEMSAPPQDETTYADLLDRAGFLASYQRDYNKAILLTEACLMIRRRLDDRRGVGDSLALLGFIRLQHGEFGPALTLNEEALAIHRQLGNHQGVADASANLSVVAFHQGDVALALRLAREGLEIWERLGDKQGVGWATQLLGRTHIRVGAYKKAEELYLRGLKEVEEIGHRWGLALALEGFAGLAVAGRQWEKALVLAGGAAAIRHNIGLPLSAADQAFYNKTLQPAYLNLSAEEVANAQRKGESLSTEDLITLAKDFRSGTFA